MTDGQVTALEWRNGCYDGKVCPSDSCVDTSVTINATSIDAEDVTFQEDNCVKKDCGAGSTHCDT